MNKSKWFAQKHEPLPIFNFAYCWLWSLLLAITLLVGTSWSVVAQSTTMNQFLPLVATDPSRANPTQQPATCEFSSSTQELATLFKTDSGQMRPTMTCNPILMQVAQERAEDMATNDYFGHVNLSGQGPNYLVRDAGYDLASFYSTTVGANEIESIVAGVTNSAGVAWEQWLQSSSHRPHVLGLSSVFQQQRDYGIGYVYDPSSRYKRYWVLITAEPATLQ